MSRWAREPAEDAPLADLNAWEALMEGSGSSTWDFCADCAPNEGEDWHSEFDGPEPYNGEPEGEDGGGGRWVAVGPLEHPSYDDSEYLCTSCTCTLDQERDG